MIYFCRDLEQNVKTGYTSEDPPPYSRTPERTPEPVHRQTNKSGGYYSDTGRFDNNLKSLRAIAIIRTYINNMGLKNL